MNVHSAGRVFHDWPEIASEVVEDERSNLVEIEAEAVAFIVTKRLGLKGSSAAYLSGYLTSDKVPTAVSMESIAKVAGHIERMAREVLPTPRHRKRQQS